MSKTFYDFLKLFEGDESPLGELVNDISNDTEFPKDVDSELKVRDYFESITRNFRPGFHAALNKALEMYNIYNS